MEVVYYLLVAEVTCKSADRIAGNGCDTPAVLLLLSKELLVVQYSNQFIFTTTTTTMMMMMMMIMMISWWSVWGLSRWLRWVTVSVYFA